MEKEKRIQYWMKVYRYYYQEYEIAVKDDNWIAKEFWGSLCFYLQNDMILIANS